MCQHRRLYAGKRKEVYLFLDKHVKSEKGHVLWYIHSIGEWETCQRRYNQPFSLFLVLQPKTITSINVRTQDMSTPAKKLPWHNMFNAFFGLKTDFNQKKRKSRNYHWSFLDLRFFDERPFSGRKMHLYACASVVSFFASYRGDAQL